MRHRGKVVDHLHRVVRPRVPDLQLPRLPPHRRHQPAVTAERNASKVRARRNLPQRFAARLLDVAALAPEPAVAMPSAPFSAPSAPKTAVQMTDEERELAELEASMAM